MATSAFSTAASESLAETNFAARRRLGISGYVACFKGIVWREILRYLHQRERFLSALVRPLIWLFIFAAGFRQTLGVSIIPPYETYVLYEEFIAPGLIAMILLFNAMQSSLSMVYDRETGTMRTLLVSPFPRSFLLLSKLLGGVSVALLQAFAFLFVAYWWGIQPPPITEVKLFTFFDPPSWAGNVIPAMGDPIVYTLFSVPDFLQPALGYIAVVPAIVLGGLMLGALALFISSVIKQLENFAGVMNFVIFPMFFASSALYPLWRIREASPLLYEICRLNPFTYAVELVRFALYGQIDTISLAIVVACTVIFLGAAVFAYNPSKGLIARRGGPGGPA
ncbi:ABC-2 type transporter [Hyphomicrobium denitrificans ATCC 51888]|uniref:Transport permease protein n=1 Tax=Hyphomicrobium denitrificans (strain ATCC 51888 / DSM 1869 / NCIMB 11706 / TK 0415) TaxID=582899 RepID=D8JXR1_HYPDA|nr:ABC transporter permease [Hyphomicrobium denitrificans]ADJ23270.1 ABC-2 type transporter [Hyphomicrobium denitrificans ATCC 51888]